MSLKPKTIFCLSTLPATIVTTASILGYGISKNGLLSLDTGLTTLGSGIGSFLFAAVGTGVGGTALFIFGSGSLKERFVYGAVLTGNLMGALGAAGGYDMAQIIMGHSNSRRAAAEIVMPKIPGNPIPKLPGYSYRIQPAPLKMG